VPSAKKPYYFPITDLKILYSEQKLTVLLQEIADLKQRCQKYMHDFTLFKRRMNQIRQDMEKKVAFEYDKKLVPILDMFEQIQQLNFKHLKSSKLRIFTLKLLDNLDVLYNRLLKVTEIIPIVPQRGTPYDDQFQDAISLQYEPTFPPHTIVQVIRRGYLFDQTLLRPAEVVLSTNQRLSRKEGRLQTFFNYFKRIFRRRNLSNQ